MEPGSLLVLAGAPGTGKSILTQQICFANATPENKAIYYTTLAEPHLKLVKHLEQFSFFDREALEVAVEFIHLGDLVEDGSEEPIAPIVDEVALYGPAHPLAYDAGGMDGGVAGHPLEALRDGHQGVDALVLLEQLPERAA